MPEHETPLRVRDPLEAVAIWPVGGTAAALLPDVGALAWIQRRMVVHIAAVYSHDLEKACARSQRSAIPATFRSSGPDDG